ncbi:MAG: S1/P1 nuclease [Acidobacteriota bacterium]
MLLIRSFTIRSFAAAIAALLLALPAGAWNYSGHSIIAQIAYERLTPQVRARVDRMIRDHPDYERVFTREAPDAIKNDPGALARYAFVHAAPWPDMIRSDMRFYDEANPDAQPTPLLPGFPDMMRHGTWHYFDNPISGDGTPVIPLQPPHLMTELFRLLAEIGTADSQQAAYDLPWLEHLVGDVHQPLHLTSRFLRSQPKGDAGGNFVIVEPGRTLHALWDDAAAPRDLGDHDIVRYAREIAAEYPQRALLSLEPIEWAAESFELDTTAVYTFGLGTGSHEHPLVLPREYEEKAKHIARQRVAIAGSRLAGILNKYVQ